MTELWLPPSAYRSRAEKRAEHYAHHDPRGRELVDKRKDFIAQLMECLYTEGGILDEFNRELQQLDPRLRLVQATDTVPGDVPLKPGYYHIMRLNENAPPWIQAIEGPNGEFGIPSSKLLDRLREADLQNPRAVAERQRIDREATERKEKEKRVFREERRDEIFERFQAATRTQVSLNDETPWAQNHAGLKRTKGNKK